MPEPRMEEGGAAPDFGTHSGTAAPFDGRAEDEGWTDAAGTSASLGDLDVELLSLSQIYANMSEAELHAAHLSLCSDVVTQLGLEVDRLERVIRRQLPEIAFVDLELL